MADRQPIPSTRGFTDLTGRTFGRLAVLFYAGRPSAHHAWQCLCQCGSEVTADHKRLMRGDTKSCGCLQKEATIAKNKSRIRPPKGSGITSKFKSEFGIYRGMKQRCLSPRCKDFGHYGGRGITICERWIGRTGFANFMADMGPRPSTKHSIDRKDNDGPYSPDNCRWATKTEQLNNTRCNRFIEHAGERLTIAEWSARTGIAQQTIGDRLSRGLPIELVLSTHNLSQIA
jgi:hypothetical protein